jgi:hypothetical protein
MAGSLKDTFENALLLLLFQNSNIAAVGDATGLRGSSTAGNFYIALYTSAPNDSAAGTETSYTNYARVAVTRSSAGWTVSGNQVSNTASISFPACGATGATVVAAAICKAGTTGVDDAIAYATLDANKTIANGDAISFAAGALSFTLD